MEEKKKMTQEDMVMDYIHKFGSISSWQAFTDLGITRLAAKICKLKKQGFSFKKEDVTTRNRYGKSVTFRKYSLLQENA